MSPTTAYRSGIALVRLTAFLIVWTTIVRDDGSGAGNFMIILAAVVGGYAVRFDATGLASIGPEKTRHKPRDVVALFMGVNIGWNCCAIFL